MNELQKLGGVAALLHAVIYISAFIFFGAVWDFPTEASIAEKLLILKESQTILSIVNLIMYVIFGILLAVLVLAIHHQINDRAEILSQLAAVFGFIWVALVISSGMISNVGLDVVVALSLSEPEQARAVWLTVDTIVEGIGGGNEIIGGMWVLLVSIAGIKANWLSDRLHYLGVFVGVSGISTVYPAVILTEIFGLSQIVWFIWLGIVMYTGTKQ